MCDNDAVCGGSRARPGDSRKSKGRKGGKPLWVMVLLPAAGGAVSVEVWSGWAEVWVDKVRAGGQAQ